MRHAHSIALPLCALLLAGCSLFTGRRDAEKSDKDPPPKAPELVGRIASIPPDRRFVLIQSYGSRKLEQGRLLTTRGPEERTANLLVTGESLGQFVAADLQAGTVEIGDAVYSHHLPKPPEPSPTASDPTEPTENQQPGPG